MKQCSKAEQNNWKPYITFGRPTGLPEELLGLLPTTASLGGGATSASAYFLGLPLGLVDLGCWSGTIEGKGTAAKGMSVVC
jgi:hypothetical protein